MQEAPASAIDSISSSCETSDGAVPSWEERRDQNQSGVKGERIRNYSLFEAGSDGSSTCTGGGSLESALKPWDHKDHGQNGVRGEVLKYHALLEGGPASETEGKSKAGSFFANACC